MEFVYTPSPLPTLGRWRALGRKYPGESVLRSLEYERLETADIHGHVLDIGGGRKSRTNVIFPPEAQADSVNIQPEMDPTYLVEPDEPFPIADDAYDTAVCLNTLEHVYDAKFVIREIHRVLKPGGTVYISVPFMFRIHASPDDFFRGTPTWWKETLRLTGFARTELQPLVWGRYSTAQTISGCRGVLPAALQRNVAYLKDILYAALTFHGVDRYEGRRGDRISAVAPGWFVAATK